MAETHDAILEDWQYLGWITGEVKVNIKGEQREQHQGTEQSVDFLVENNNIRKLVHKSPQGIFYRRLVLQRKFDELIV